MFELNYQLAGDRGILIHFKDEVSEEVFQRVVSFEKGVLAANLPGVSETIRSYSTLFVAYDPLKTNHEALIQQLQGISRAATVETMLFPKKRILEVPILYGRDYGPDLPLLAQMLEMSQDEVIRRHLSHDYLIYITAFLGGAAFFKGTDKMFDVPRKKTPVLLHPQGTVNLANGLGTAFMPMDSPTGWYGIGRSPLRQWYPDRDPPVLIKSGDWIRYKRIDQEEFKEIRKAVDLGEYEVKNLATEMTRAE